MSKSNKPEKGSSQKEELIHKKSAGIVKKPKKFFMNSSWPVFMNNKVIAIHTLFGYEQYFTYDLDNNKIDFSYFDEFTCADLIAFSPKTCKLVFTGWDLKSDVCGIYITDNDSKGFKRILKTRHHINSLAYSPDETFVIYEKLNSSNDGLHYIDLIQNTDNFLLEDVFTYNLSRDGTKIVFDKRKDKNIYIMDLKSKVCEKIVTGRRPVWSPDGEYIAYNDCSNNKSQIGIIKIDGTKRRLVTPDGINACDPNWSPDGSYLAFNIGRDICAYFMETGKIETLVSEGTELWITDISSDSNMIAFCSLSDQGEDDEAYVFKLKEKKMIELGKFIITPEFINSIKRSLKKLEKFDAIEGLLKNMETKLKEIEEKSHVSKIAFEVK